MSQEVKRPPMPEAIDISEYGAPKDGEKQKSDRRMYFQLQVFTECHDLEAVKNALDQSGLELVLYKDVNDPRGIGILVMAENPAVFAEGFRELLSQETFLEMTPKDEMTMIGRTYSIGREPDLEDWLLNKPRKNMMNPENTWAILYPLKRKPEFGRLGKEDHGRILGEHAMIGRSYGMAGLAQDLRLACQGIDKNDNDFVIGLVGKELYPLSKCVQDMRKTEQTAHYLESLGPFFVGKVYWQSGLNS